MEDYGYGVDYDEFELEAYWEELQALGRKHDENILDKQAWCEPFVYDNKSASEAFYEEFPEHKDK